MKAITERQKSWKWVAFHVIKFNHQYKCTTEWNSSLTVFESSSRFWSQRLEMHFAWIIKLTASFWISYSFRHHINIPQIREDVKCLTIFPPHETSKSCSLSDLTVESSEFSEVGGGISLGVFALVSFMFKTLLSSPPGFLVHHVLTCQYFDAFCPRQGVRKGVAVISNKKRNYFTSYLRKGQFAQKRWLWWQGKKELKLKKNFVEGTYS